MHPHVVDKMYAEHVAYHTAPHCVRCEASLHNVLKVRHVCAACHYELASAHWKHEFLLFGKTVYMLEPGEPEYFKAEYSKVFCKPSAPKPPKEAPAHVY